MRTPRNVFSCRLRPSAVPALALLALAPLAAKANDSAAVIGSGGIVLATTEDVSMDREDLYISPSAVRVDYVFTNRTNKTVETVIAFPMPDIEFRSEEYAAVPDPQSDNFMDFKVVQDGAPIDVELQQRASAAGLDVTSELKAARVPLQALNDKTQIAIDALPAETKSDWAARGILREENGGGEGAVGYVAGWKLQSTYWWRTVFPAGQSVKVHHSYKPSVGGTVDTAFLMDGKKSDSFPDYARRYCVNDNFVKVVLKAKADLGKDDYLMEKWLSYILMTGNNWQGPIGTFHLTVDKEDPSSLVSFCGDGVKKTGPTTFEMTAKDYYPQRDLDVLVVYRQNVAQ